MSELRPWQPAAGDWNAAAAAHLLRRAGFAPSRAEIDAAVAAGLDATLDDLLADAPDTARHAELDELGAAIALRNDVDALRGWWLLRMTHTRRPLHARLAVFWHGHFATSNSKVRSAAMMLQQLRVFERLGAGPFEALLLAVSRDPAMIVWLDGDENVKGRPNENYARELFELFALGVGHYSERDIREAARAFTGWGQKNGVYRFDPLEHDDGEKTVLGHVGRFSGEDVVRLTIEQPACTHFLARKLLHEFLAPAPSAQLVEEFAAQLRATRFHVTEALRTLFRSAAFFSPEVRRARIKSPVEFVIGLVRSLEISAPAAQLARAVTETGQRLFEPPSVKGWDGHRAWLDSATMLVRLNAALRTLDADVAPLNRLREKYALGAADGVRAYCAAVTVDDPPPAALHAALDEIPDADLDRLFRQSLRLLLTAPEYQMA